MKFQGFAVKTAFAHLRALGLIAGPGPGQALLLRHVEDQCQVGPEAAGHGVVEKAEPAEIHASGKALVGVGGVSVAVTEHHFACRERGADNLGHVLGPVGKKEAELRVRGNLAVAVEKQGAQGLSEA